MAATSSPWFRRALIGAAVVVVLALIGAWQLGLFSSEPEEANLADAIAAESADTDTDTEDGADEQAEADAETPAVTTPPAILVDDPGGVCAVTADPEGAGSTTAVSSGADLAGTWSVRRSEGTFVGYRIDEILSGVDFEAVGRSATVSGSVVATESQITEVSIAADLRDLTSDNGARDNQLKSQALESETFPVACFTLTSPIEVTEVPAEGVEASFTATGDLTIHGVTRSVQLDLQATTTGGRLFIVGSTDVALVDFDIDPPEASIVAGVGEIAVMEFSLVLSR